MATRRPDRIIGGSLMKLRVRVLRRACATERRWYADIDDADDPQPDDPFWYVDNCRTQYQALTTACERLAELTDRRERLVRILEAAD